MAQQSSRHIDSKCAISRKVRKTDVEADACLVVCAEVPSLCLPVVEASPHDLIATIQLGDGAAAAVVASRQDGCGAEIVATRSQLFPLSTEASSAKLTADGLRLVESAAFQRVVRQHLAAVVGDFLGAHGRRMGDVDFWVIHPRSLQLLQRVRETLGLPEDALTPSRRVWEHCGNVLSATPLLIMRELQEQRPPAAGALGLMLALGAGVSCELALLRW